MIVIRSQDSSTQGAPRKGGRKLVGVALLGVAVMLGQTFAANISIGTGGSLEFGQGIQVQTACAGNNPITLKPKTSFANVSGGGSIKFSSIDVSGVPSTCIGSRFSFTAYGETSTVALPIFNSNQSSAIVMMKQDSTFVTNPDAIGITVTTLSNSSFSITFANPASDSKLVYRLTIESRAASCSDGVNCAIGDLGPGGGTVFMIPSTSGNTSGLTFEIAPADVSGTYAMCTVQTVNLALNNSIGWGESNTATIMANSNCNTSANGAYVARNYNGGGQSDWFLPSQQELKIAKDNILNSYSNWNGSYMTSSSPSSNAIWFVDFGSIVTCGGGLWPICSTYKDTAVNIRPVRSF